MSKSGFNIDGIEFISNWEDDTHVLNAQVDAGLLYISTSDNHAIKQHDFEMSRSEWELFKRLVDIQFIEEVAE